MIALAAGQFVQEPQIGVQILRVGDLLEGELLKLIGREAQHPAQRWVDGHETPFRGHQGHAHRGMTEDSLQQLRPMWLNGLVHAPR
ncbi:hypothetical protein J2X99_001871 [Deinococcus soli (ex Cha et al. 2016)]|nr:hypothetical protein [Deinococcus soli (ex Cha et al. 2016)]